MSQGQRTHIDEGALLEILSTLDPKELEADLQTRSDHIVCALETAAQTHVREALRSFGMTVDAGRHWMIRRVKRILYGLYERDPRLMDAPEKKDVDHWERISRATRREIHRRLGALPCSDFVHGTRPLITLLADIDPEERASILAHLPPKDFQDVWKAASDSCREIVDRMPEKDRREQQYPPAVLKLEEIIAACATVRTRRQREEER